MLHEAKRFIPQVTTEKPLQEPRDGAILLARTPTKKFHGYAKFSIASRAAFDLRSQPRDAATHVAAHGRGPLHAIP